MGICHQVNLEYLARVVFTTEIDGESFAYPDTLVGTDSHTTMINGLGVLGWGVGGIEAEAAMLGQPVSMLVPQVVGYKLTGKLREGATATDLVLTVTQALRKLGVVGKFVEFYGPGIAELPLADRATISNMAPEYGATCGIFPVDAETLRYLRLTGRSEEQIALVEAYYKEQGLFHTAGSPEAEYTQTLELDLATVEPSVAGPKRPQDRVLLKDAAASFAQQLPRCLRPRPSRWARARRPRGSATMRVAPIQRRLRRQRSGCIVTTTVKERFGVDPDTYLDHGSVVIAAITSCTNTSNPSVMVAAGILAKKAVEKGLTVPPWVKTSLAPGSRVVTDYYTKAGLLPYLEKLRFNVVGYGCTTCIGNSGPLPADVSKSIDEHGLVAVSVLSGNRNFEGRVNVDVRANYLMSPPLVVAYALAGRIGHNFETDPLGTDQAGKPVYLKDIWPTQQEVAEAIETGLSSESFRKEYATVSDGDANWQGLSFPTGDVYQWEPDSTYIRQAPYFDGMTQTPAPVTDIRGRARAGGAGRLGDHRPHFAGGQHQGQRAGREISCGARREAGGLQQLWLAARQSRSDGARHLCQCAAAQQTCAGHRGRRHAAAARGRADVDLRRQREVCRARRAAGDSRGQGVRFGLFARLGGQRARSCWACAR